VKKVELSQSFRESKFLNIILKNESGSNKAQGSTHLVKVKLAVSTSELDLDTNKIEQK
jgi:hypothetical protein